MKQIALRLKDDTAAAVERARGAGTEREVKREPWIREAIERRLRLDAPTMVGDGRDGDA
jgi:hypothetical protein